MMKILQIGSGSMGTRRLRDLRARADVALALHDERADRRQRAHERFGIPVFADLAAALAWGPDALVISTPPGSKGPYVRLALERGLHHFIEADIWSYGAAEVERVSREKALVSAPSASLLYLPVVRELRAAVREHLGQLISYQFFMATYMPGWHPGEGAEYYARHRDTAPAREMIPFELNWLHAAFGPAREVAGHYGKHGALPGDTEDTWSLALRLRDGGTGHVAITMSCPADYRRGCCFGTKAALTWDIYGGDLAIHVAGEPAPRVRRTGAIGEVLEAMYAAEIGAFVEAARGGAPWIQPYAASQQASATLAAAERSSRSGRWEPVDLAAEPERPLPRHG